MSHLSQETITWKDVQIILPSEDDTVLVYAENGLFEGQNIYTAHFDGERFTNTDQEGLEIEAVELWAELPKGRGE